SADQPRRRAEELRPSRRGVRPAHALRGMAPAPGQSGRRAPDRQLPRQGADSQPRRLPRRDGVVHLDPRDEAGLRSRAGIFADVTVRYRNLVYDSARWDGFEFRDGDIVISTPPKCGTTWTQMLVAMLVFDATEFDRPLALISPWLDMSTRPLDSVLADLDAQTHRRFIKTHTPLDGLPWDERVTYVCVGRDPRDAGLSMDHHMSNMNFDVLLAM